MEENGYFVLSLPPLPQPVLLTKWAVQPASLQDISYIRKKMTWACNKQYGVSFRRQRLLALKYFLEIQKLQFPACQM